MALHCSECGFVNPEGANYCQKCGAFLALATDAWIGPATFLVGLVGSLLASALYLKAGLSEARRG